MATTTNGIYYPNDYNAAADIPADLKKMAESIDKNVQDNKYNDEPIKQDIQDLKDDVSDIKSNQTTQNDLLQRTQSALINITTPKSSNINVKDSSDLNAKIDVFGISEQETRSGKNKFNIEKLTGTNITDKDSKTGAFKMSNCWGIIIMDNASLQEILKPNTQYKCIADVTLLSKPDDLNASNSSQILSLYNNQDVVVVNMLFTSNKQEKDNWEVNTKKHLSATFTTPADLTGFSMIGYNYRTERATNEGSFKFENIMILEATEDDESFEQYGASPSPEYPSEIKNVTGNIDITVCNKNIFNKENYDALSDYAVQMEGNMSSYKGKLLQLKPNTTYAVSRLINNFDASGSWVLRILDADKVTPLAILQELSCTSDIKVTITTRETGIIYIAELYATDERLEDFFSKCEIQIEENNSSTDYLAHKKQLITFPLAQGQKLYKGDYPADDGIHHKRKQIELDGTENWILSGLTTNNQYILTVPDIKIIGENNKGNLISSHFKEITGVEGYNNNNINGISGWSSTQIRISLDISIINRNVAKFKNWLAQQKTNGTPVTIEYPLTEEEIEEYTEEQQEAYNQLQNVLSYKTVTNVFTDNALLEFKYIADTQTWVVNLVKNEVANTNKQLLEIAGGN